MRETWTINRIGLVDFWYYDDQEFSFINGRMLLRGANGSGKSVTMQSVVPLLLDGNMRPERLDPFGSRDRKMSNYLLEEGDGREERTGYLYMEFLKPETGIYHTIGMGIRARKGKTLETWYFYISDNRRINRDFYLYKETDVKITLSRKELENRISNGGRVLATQQEYMEHVNKAIFGFESAEEYKEMIDLLIQLRTPKLSKDFKPTVINEILSNSLQPLSEEDLRPMSEAIENMDTMSANLANKQGSMQAAEKIDRQYRKYNEFVLKEKIEKYLDALNTGKELERSIKKAKSGLEENIEGEKRAQQKKKELEHERQVLENEKETLNASDALSLKQREADVEGRLKENKKSEESKEEQLEAKEASWRRYSHRIKEEEAKRSAQESHLAEKLQEMGDDLTEVFADEHSFFAEDFQAGKEKEFSFEAHFTQIHRLAEKLAQGTEALGKMEEQKSQREALLQQYDQEKKARSAMERGILEEENRLQEMLQEHREKIYTWSHANQELKLSAEALQKIDRFLDLFDYKSDYHELKGWVWDIHASAKNKISRLLNRQEEALLKEEEKLEKLREELANWQNQEDPAPELTAEVQESRERLTAKGISYNRFYEMIDFEQGISQEQANYLEEALLQMGLLDALVIDEAHKAEVLQLNPGSCDKYIFAEEARFNASLAQLLTVSAAKNDIIGNHQTLSVLGSIATKSEEASYILPDGTYGLGVLKGTITGEYRAKYIGAEARAQHKQEQIALLKEQVSEQEVVVFLLQDEIQESKGRMEQLDQEYENLPQGNLLHEKANQIEEKRFDLKNQTERMKSIEEEIKEKTEQVRLLLESAKEIADPIYMACNYSDFKTALEEMKVYDKRTMELKMEHSQYLRITEGLAHIQAAVEDLDADIGQIRDDLAEIQNRIHKENLELDSIRKQLALTNYEEIKDRLDYCMGRLLEISEEIERAIKDEGECRHASIRNREIIEQTEPAFEKNAKKTKVLKTNLKKELALKLTLHGLETEEEENWASEIAKIHAALVHNSPKEEDKESLGGKVNQAFYENRGYLLDFNPNLQNIFEEDSVEEFPEIHPKRLEITARYRGENVKLGKLLEYLREEIEEMQNLIKSGDKELFEDILANTIGRKIRNRINASTAWVAKMNDLMESMNTSSGLKLSLRWRSKTAEQEDQLDTKELVDLLKKDARLMNETEFTKLSQHFRSKVEQARRNTKESLQPISFFAIMRDTLDYRKWFEFQLFFQKGGETKKELTNNIFGTFSGGEKAMSMYVPLFSAVAAKYQGAREDVPRIVSLDEAFAGVDNRNIRDMFRLMSEFQFNFIINSQVLWGDSDTLDGLAIYQLHRLNNQKFVTVMSYIWNGEERKTVAEIKN